MKEIIQMILFNMILKKGDGRVGHPRLDWVTVTLGDLWNSLRDENTNLNREWVGSDAQKGLIKKAALDRAKYKNW